MWALVAMCWILGRAAVPITSNGRGFDPLLVRAASPEGRHAQNVFHRVTENFPSTPASAHHDDGYSGGTSFEQQALLHHRFGGEDTQVLDRRSIVFVISLPCMLASSGCGKLEQQRVVTPVRQHPMLIVSVLACVAPVQCSRADVPPFNGTDVTSYWQISSCRSAVIGNLADRVLTRLED